MRPNELLTQVAGVFERLGVNYAVVGSMASSFYGESRLTKFNVIHPESGLKIDVIIPSASAFDQLCIRRRVRVAPPDVQAPLYFASPEDVVLKKMEFYREGGSDKHLRDIAGILKIRGDGIDRPYIADWAQRLGVSEIWTMILAQIDAPRK